MFGSRPNDNLIKNVRETLFGFKENTTMKNSISLSRYPANYTEENLPDVLVEIRYKKKGHFNREKATILAKEISVFLDSKKEHKPVEKKPSIKEIMARC